MKDGAVFIGQKDSTAERIEGFGHPRAHDSADIEQVVDRYRPPQMREQQLAKLDLALSDETLPVVPTHTQNGEMHWRLHQEEHYEVNNAGLLYALLKMSRPEIGGKVAGDHKWLV
jgi:hypothetical protein